MAMLADPISPPNLCRATTAESGHYSFESDSDDDGIPIGGDLGATFTELAPRSGVRIVEPRELKVVQNQRLWEAVELLGLPEDDALLLLRQARWSSAALVEAYFGSSDLASFRQDAGVRDRKGAGPTAGHLCGICFAGAPMDLLPCGHSAYCEDCWKQYVQRAVQEGKGCLDLRCPTPKCGERLRPSHIRSLCGGTQLAERYDRFLLEAFVEEASEWRWCPGPGCGRAAEVARSAPSRVVRCPCRFSWCFDCGGDLHLPVSCATVQQWNTRNQDSGADAMWLVANTKACPKCKNPIEKNGGCMHMTCRKPGGCGHEFCWICLQDWKGHSACNQYKKEESQDVRDARSELQRYAHFYERYRAHEKAQLYASRHQREHIDGLVRCLVVECGVPLKTAEFLGQAVDEIVHSRRFLKWTYAHAFVKNLSGNERSFFEFNQAQLEGTLERLSDLMENTNWGAYLDAAAPLDDRFAKVRTQVISLTGVVQSSFTSLETAMAKEEDAEA